MHLLVKKIWLWAMSKHIWLSATHIPGAENDADFKSRHFSDNVECMINKNAAQNIMSLWDRLEIDKFASRLSKQLDRYVSSELSETQNYAHWVINFCLQTHKFYNGGVLRMHVF